MLVDEIIIDCPELGTDKIVTMVKEKETYNFRNTLASPGTYSVVERSCKPSGTAITGNIIANGNYIFTPEKDGTYIITFSVDDKRHSVIITHYPTIIKSVVKGTFTSLCGDTDGCGCGDCNELANACLSYQDLFAETQLLLGILKSIPNCEGQDVIKCFISASIDLYKCDMFSLFCDKELELKLKGQSEFSNRLTKKLVAINYLALYLYEKWITNPLEEYINFVDSKYRFKAIKDCLLYAGVDTFGLQTLFDQITTPCDDTTPCTTGCFNNVEAPALHQFSFIVGTDLNGIYHTFTIKNVCAGDFMFFDRLIFADTDFKVEIRNKSGANPATVLPNGTLELDVKFVGTKDIPTVITVPFIYQGVLLNTYEISFVNPDTPNRPPVIVDIIKELENRIPYTFTVQDFEDHFTDPDGDILERIMIVGDTSRFTLNGQPYVSGTEINRTNITDLVYTPLDTDLIYQIILNWMAWDSHGLPSN